MQKTWTLYERLYHLHRETIPTKETTGKPKRVAVVEEEEQELKDLAKEMEEATIGKVMIQDF